VTRSGGTERGAALAEFAFAFPVLVLLLMAVLDVGHDYGRRVQTTHAAREGARAGSVGRVGDDDTCPTAGIPLDARTAELVCLVKHRTHVDAADVRVRVAYMDADGGSAEDFSAPTRRRNPYSLMVCVATPAVSLSGMLAPMFDGRFHHARSVIKTGAMPWATRAADGSAAPSYPAPFTESPLDGDDWVWCRSDDPARDVEP
jgi:hypothetical protein